eukprot:TRINITY_DN10897_c0_g1_i11.p2 TRINITY_DN10897_c0_g1~~TRINITY_DN10897_c0_g1_i11.p2  ORF type:complete len:255 (+),score=19.37 TRINITY_DN10897_c0_g1_i11:1865-2629(+)
MIEILLAVSGPICIAGFAYSKRMLTQDGAIAAIPVGILPALLGVSETLMLLLFFLSGSMATKLLHSKSRSKVTYDNDAKTGRNAMQVLATGGIPALLCLAALITGQNYHEPYMAYLACSCGDTLASEFGQTSKIAPRLITTWQQVSPGQDGAVSFLGTAASLAGGLLIGLPTTSLTMMARSIVYAGIGSIADSMLGAMLQPPKTMSATNWKRWNVIVNLLSSLMMAVFSLVLPYSGLAQFLCAALLAAMLIALR